MYVAVLVIRVALQLSSLLVAVADHLLRFSKEYRKLAYGFEIVLYTLVYPVIDSVPFRAAPIRQIKAWLAGNGAPFPRATTQSGRTGAAPFGLAPS